MKFTLTTLALFLAGTSAAPAATPTPNPYPYSIDQITLYHLIESNTWDLTISITKRDPYGAALESTSCHSAWIDGATYVAREVCQDPNYAFWLPNGAPNPREGWDVIVDGPAGQAEGAIAYGPKYSCGPYEGEIGNIDTECATRNGGWFFLHERESV
ncbi:hypothetical protein ASPSYDRAFT_29071 [Aspergillus sydowii CBS 593.65]|uniref:AA1-like domain-containing protein n=1 Tax=Aspergillus sydowii CBS 593.65 TaxID=1036612 RepID=A0A1L9TM97_9EURO|nr:uncharacterized protein ASPSYDRAFT_29071 [Aspergillus sydowii CBS 593.65]OJJ60538.1 hypothetical protein ASPSYDRAFT_29071 [Aspergillus sydowii CBS 593.65]